MLHRVRFPKAGRLWRPTSIIVALAAVLAVEAGAFAGRGPSAAAPPALVAGGTADTAHGRSIYDTRCAECHGKSGQGDGPAGLLLLPRPRNFVRGVYKFRSTESGSLPTDEDLVETIANGLPGSSMPAWSGLLTADEIRSVVGYVKSFNPRFATDPPRPITIGKEVAPSPASVERGAAIYKVLQCRACHGTDGRGTGAIATDLKDDFGAPDAATDLSQPWTFRGGDSAVEIFKRFRGGITGTGMPSYVDTASDEDMWHLANYVKSLARKPVWTMTAAEITAHYAQEAEQARQHPAARGAYLVNSIGCAHCHSPLDQDGAVMPGLALAGGQRWVIGAYGEWVTKNLTSDKATGIGDYTDEQLRRAITAGVRPNGNRLLPFPMPWTAFAGLSADDVGAIIAYLRTVPPVRNSTPEPGRLNPFTYMWQKFEMLILGKPLPFIRYPGNAGQTGGRS